LDDYYSTDYSLRLNHDDDDDDDYYYYYYYYYYYDDDDTTTGSTHEEVRAVEELLKEAEAEVFDSIMLSVAVSS
jgi:hypothetical protein